MHPKYWTRPRLMAPLEGEGSAGGGSADSLADAFAAHFEDSAPADPPSAAPATETDDDAAARQLAADAAGDAPQLDAAQPGDAPADAPQQFTVKIDGKDVVLTAEQIAENHKAGLRQADYTKKTMEVAEQRKAVEAESAKARTEREQYATKLEHFSITANSELGQLQAELTQELLRSDPLAFMEKKHTLETRQVQLAQAQRELEQINGQRQQEREQSVKQFLQHQEEILADKLPDWKDPAKKQALMGKLEPFLREQGFSEQDAMTVLDARILMMAHDAMKFRDLLTRAKSTQSTVAKAPAKVARTGTPAVAPTDGRTSAMRELTATGSRDAAAKVFADMFG